MRKGFFRPSHFLGIRPAGNCISAAGRDRFPGMLTKRTFHIILVGPAHGTGIETTALPDKIIYYDGGEQQIQF